MNRGETLAECPFCGATGDDLMLFCDPQEGLDNSGPSRRVQCAGCNVEAPYYSTQAEAIEAWNRRTPTAAGSGEVTGIPFALIEKVENRIAYRLAMGSTPRAIAEDVMQIAALSPCLDGSGAEARALLDAFSIFTIEDDEGIRLSTGGHVIAHYGDHSPEGIAMLKLEALCRSLRSSLSRKNTGEATWERRVEWAENFLKTYASGDRQKLLGGYDFPPIVLSLAGAVQQLLASPPLPETEEKGL